MSQNFIVIFKDSATQDEVTEFASRVNSGGGTVNREFEGDFLKGFAATLTPELFSSFTSLTDNGPIKYIEPDSIVTTQ